jgi:hypothetical protein
MGVALALGVAACSSSEPAPAVATLSAAIASPVASPGSPVVVRYVMSTLGRAPLPDGQWLLFVHFVSDQGEILWTDDHPPAVPTGQWKPGTPVEYARTTFVPRTGYTGPVFVDAGLVDPKTSRRLSLQGTDVGMLTYRLGSFAVQPGANDTFIVFGDGWYDAETGSEGLGISWRWSRAAAALSFRNPKRDAQLLLEVDQPLAASVAPPQVGVAVGGSTVATFDMKGPKEILVVPLDHTALGDGDSVSVTLSVRPTFVPAAVPQLRSIDSRQLGVRLFNAYVATR